MLAYLYVATPQLIRPIVAVFAKKEDVRSFLSKAVKILRQAARLESFPACAAILIAASTAAPTFLSNALRLVQLSKEGKRRAAKLQHSAALRFLAIFITSTGVFHFLNRLTPEQVEKTYFSARIPEKPSRVNQLINRQSIGVLSGSGGSSQPPTPLTHTPVPVPQRAGKTLFITSFGIVNASIIVASAALNYYRKSSPSHSWSAPGRKSRVGVIAPTSAFMISSTVIMWAWFFNPEQLPRDYNKWITSAAQIDLRLIETLRQVRKGNFIYGKDTGRCCSLAAMARDHGFPVAWADPAKSSPIPCELYHSGTGKSCEWHALSRFWRAWLFAMRIYLPLNLAIFLQRRPNAKAVGRAVQGASQSAAFLSSFISLFYYGVCLARTRIGPKIVGTSTSARQLLDSGICVATGCVACGWSILVEKESRRTEMALFVAPRALSTLLPRRYDRKVSLAPPATAKTASAHGEAFR